MRLLAQINHPGCSVLGRPPQYNQPALTAVLRKIWLATDHMCSKRRRVVPVSLWNALECVGWAAQMEAHGIWPASIDRQLKTGLIPSGRSKHYPWGWRIAWSWHHSCLKCYKAFFGFWAVAIDDTRWSLNLYARNLPMYDDNHRCLKCEVARQLQSAQVGRKKISHTSILVSAFHKLNIARNIEPIWSETVDWF